MALTFAVTDRGVRGNQRFTDFTVNFDNNYPTGGEAIAAADLTTLFGHGGVIGSAERVYMEPDATTGKYGTFDRTNSKILLFDGIAGQVANASDQSTVTLRGTATYNTL
jgi:hypothetical protein